LACGGISARLGGAFAFYLDSTTKAA